MTPNQFKNQLLSIRAHALKPRSRRTVVEWAMSERVLSGQNSAIPGPWRPLFRASEIIMEAVTRKGVRSISIMAAAQMLKSDILLNTLGYFLSENPTSVILAQPSEKAAEDFSRTRVAGLVGDCQILRSNITQSDDGVFLKKFKTGGKVNIISAAAPSELASRSAKVVLLDEIDRYQNLIKEGDPEQLLVARTTTFFDSIIIAVSTPTNAGTSRIEKRFDAGSQHKFHGLCPHCNELEHLKWENVQWQKNQPDTAVYVCSQCSNPWNEYDRMQAIKYGDFIAEKPEETTHLSYHVNCIASPFQPLSHFAGLFIEASKSPESLRSFVNVYLAETWKPKVDVPEWGRLYERRELYPLRTIPVDSVAFVTAGVDVQADRLEVQTVGWTQDKQAYVIDYKVIVGYTHTDTPWNELYSYVTTSNFQVSGRDKHLPIAMTCIDSGFNSQKVYDFVSKFSPNKVRAIKGSDTLRNSVKMGSDIQINYNGTKNRFGHKIWIVGSSMLKESIYANLKLSGAGDDGVYPSGFIHTPQLGEEYFKGLTAEALQKTRSGKYEWVKTSPRNEPLDTFVYARAAAAMFGLDTFTKNDWKNLLGENVSVPQHKAQPKPQNRPPQSSSLWKNQGLRKRF